MKYLNRIIYLFLILVQTAAAQSVNVPSDYWGYDFIDRCETKGLCSSVELRVKPWSRTTFAEMIVRIEKNAAISPESFSKTDRRLLEQLKGDFIGELATLSPDTPVTGGERHLFSIRENNSVIHFDLLAQQNIITNNGDQYDPNERLSETTAGGILRGHLGGAIGFYADARNSLLKGTDVENEIFDVSQGSPVVLSGSNVYRDRATAYFVWERPWLRLQVGRDEMEWGPGYNTAG